MRILLIEPPFERFIGFRCEWFPLGLVSISTYLETLGYCSKTYNAEHANALPYIDIESYAANFYKYRQHLTADNGAVWKEVQDTLEGFKPDIVGLSIKTIKAPSAFRVAEIAKRLLPGVYVVAGGPHPTVRPEDILASPFIDYVVRGEGEHSMAELVEALQHSGKVDDIAGISYRNNGRICHNQARPLIGDLEKLPYPNRRLLIDYEDYTSGQLGWLMTSRGCPFDCSYCSSKTMWTRRVRYRPLRDVLSEVDELATRCHVTNLTFMDDSFTVNRRYVFALCDALSGGRRSKMTWSCLTRADLLDEPMIKKLKEGGCTKVDIGVESGSETIHKVLNKGISLNSVRNAARMLRRNNLFWAAFFMMGVPGETKEDVLATLNFMKEVRPNWVCLSIFTPYPGTRLFDMAKDRGLIPENMDLALYAHQSPDNCFSDKISAEDFRQLTEMMLREFRRYNASPRALIRRFLTRNYVRDPGLFLSDLKKWVTWIMPSKNRKLGDRRLETSS